MSALEVGERETYRVPPPLDFTMLWALATLDRPDLRDPPWEPRTPPRLRPEEGDALDLFAVIRDGDVLVHHPYDDFHTSVERFVEQAVEDPNVLAIKQTVYRTSGDSPIVPALMRAAEQGKQTVCLVEVQARFDEERNIQWARALERAGVHVVYGLVGPEDPRQASPWSCAARATGCGATSTSAPATTTRRRRGSTPTSGSSPAARTSPRTSPTSSTTSPASPARRATARRWWRPTTSATASSPRSSAPCAAHTPESPSRVVMKMNSIIDGPVIQAIYRASQAGRAGRPDRARHRGPAPRACRASARTSGSISIVGRFLEHARVFAFTAGGETDYWIGSADMMARNLDNRVELVAPVEDPAARAEIQDDHRPAARRHRPGVGARARRRPGRGSSRSRAQEPLNSQEALMERASRAARPS